MPNYIKYIFGAFILLLSITCVFYWKLLLLNEDQSDDHHLHPSSLVSVAELTKKSGKNSQDKQNELNFILKPEIGEAKIEIQKRVDKVNKLCRKFHLGNFTLANGTNSLNIKDTPSPQYSYFFYNKERRIAWCPVYKAGSTTWLYNMMILAGFSEEQLKNPSKQLSVLAREVYGDGVEPGEPLEKSLKLLVVRHPFERIISAFRDKLSNASVGLEHGTAHFYEKYGRKIVQKFRTDTSLKQIEPTFEEFVRYLIKTDLILYSDDHWLPAYYSCTPCRVSYDIIAKTETYMRDQQYIINRASLKGVIHPRWQHKTTNIDNTNTTDQNTSLTNSLAKTYFSQLTRSQITALYQKYYLDFELFGYSYVEYLRFAIKNN